MAAFACPCCRRPLNLPERLRGQAVQCPSCGTPFDAPADLPTFTTQPLPFGSPTWAARLSTAAAPPDVLDPVGAVLRPPTHWLTGMVVGDALCALAWFVHTLRALDPYQPPATAALHLLGALLLYLPLGFVLLAVAKLRRRRSPRLVAFGAAVALLLAVRALLLAAWVLIPIVIRSGFDGVGTAVLLTAWALLSAAVLICGYSGGVLTLLALRRPDVRRAFRRAPLPKSEVRMQKSE